MFGRIMVIKSVLSFKLIII